MWGSGAWERDPLFSFLFPWLFLREGGERGEMQKACVGLGKARLGYLKVGFPSS